MSKNTDKASQATDKKPEAASQPDGQPTENTQANETPNGQENPPAADGSPDAATNPPADGTPAADAPDVAVDAPAPGVSVVLLPARLRNQQMTLAYPFHISRQAHNVIVAGKAHALQSLDYNPHTHRQEGLLAPYTFTDQADLDQFLAAGWAEA